MRFNNKMINQLFRKLNNRISNIVNKVLTRPKNEN